MSTTLRRLTTGLLAAAGGVSGLALFAGPPAHAAPAPGGDVCVAGGGCDFGKAGKESDAREILKPGADTNPSDRAVKDTIVPVSWARG